jgi:hypothetical protein
VYYYLEKARYDMWIQCEPIQINSKILFQKYHERSSNKNHHEKNQKYFYDWMYHTYLYQTGENPKAF